MHKSMLLRKIFYASLSVACLYFPFSTFAETINNITIQHWRQNPVINGVTMPGTFGKTAYVLTNYTGIPTAFIYNSTGTTTATSGLIDVRGFDEYTIIFSSTDVGNGTNTARITGYKGTDTSNYRAGLIAEINNSYATSITIPIMEKYFDYMSIGYKTTSTTTSNSSITLIMGQKQ